MNILETILEQMSSVNKAHSIEPAQIGRPSIGPGFQAPGYLYRFFPNPQSQCSSARTLFFMVRFGLQFN